MTAFSDLISQLTWENQRNTMSLSNIIIGTTIKPPRIFLMGVPGIGKSTWASQAPKPIFIQAEDGVDTIGPARFPLASSLENVMSNLTDLATHDHDYQTVVLDSLDPLGAFIEQAVIAEHSPKDLGYGKDVGFSLEKWRTVLDACTWLRNNKNMTIILIAHTAIKRFDNPLTDPYDRFVPRLNDRVANLISAWSTAHLFANYRIFTKETEVGFNKDIRRGIGSGERTIFTEERPAHAAKNHYSLPYELPMTWAAFSSAVAASAIKPQAHNN
jgi:hypothetical protein